MMLLLFVSDLRLTAAALPPLATGTLMLVLALSVFVRQRTSTPARLFATVLALVGGWLVPFGLMQMVAQPFVADRFARLGFFFIPAIPIAIYHFVVMLLRRFERRRILIVAGWTVAAVFSVITLLSSALVDGVSAFPWGHYPRFGRMAPLFLFYFSLPMIGTLAELLYEQHRTVLLRKKAKLTTLIVGFVVASVAAVDFIPMTGAKFYPVGFAFLILCLMVSARSIAQYRLVAINPSVAAREIVDTMADALIVCDAEGRIQVVNHAVGSIFGYTPEELYGKPIDLFVTDTNATLVNVDRLRRALGQGTLRDLEKVFRSKTGEEVDVSLSISPLRNGTVHVGSVLIARDIRQRKEAETALKHGASLLQSTLESTADGILVIDRDGNIVSYNQRFLLMWRLPLSPNLSLHRNFLEFAREQVKEPAVVDAVEKINRRPESESFDVMELKDGRIFERQSIPQKLEGVTVGRVWSFRDVTERRRAESALRASERRYRLLFERNLAGVYRTFVNGTIIDCNEAFARIFGYDHRDEVIGGNAQDFFFQGGEREAIVDLLEKVRNISGLELCLRRRDGSRVWVLENISMVDGPDGEPAMMEGTLVDISGLKIAEEQMEFQAYHDVLTCLPNRKLFIDRLTLALAQSRRTSTALAVMFLDLDHFKIVNDTLGHTTGDELLLCIAERLSKATREGDTVARLGGDEFTILVSQLHDPDDAAKIAETILEAIEEPIVIGNRQLFVTASIGIALSPVDGNDAETLLKNADSALYRAKDSGRNNYQLCTEEMKVRALERLSLENSLRRALDRGELVLHYQPVVNLVTGRISGMEALIRWEHPERGLTYPEAFIPLAESSRLIVPIGDWVLRTACAQAQEWKLLGFEPFRMSVNLSARQFQQRDLAQSVEAILRESGLDADMLELEITESTAMHNADMTVETLHLLRSMGIAISIDDFGTGYSSLNYLKRFPINTVKIDKSFVRDLNTDSSDAAIVSAVIGIARILKLRVIAEGVETQEQLAFLVHKQCEEMQGFYFSAPLEASAMTELLRDKRGILPAMREYTN